MRICMTLATLCMFCMHGAAQVIQLRDTASRKPYVMLGLPASSGGDTATVQRWGPEKLAVYSLDAKGAMAPHHLSGKYSLQQGHLCFTPLFGLQPGGRFRARATLGDDTVHRDFTVPHPVAPPSGTAHMVAIYPLARTIPANTLMFYMEFDTPMDPDDQAFRQVSVINAQGDTLQNVWRHKSYWLKDNTVLVLMLHPGRIKRGIDFMKELGEVFTPAQEYRLVVGNGLQDVYKRPLPATYERKYVIAGEDRQMPECLTGRFSKPKSGSRSALVMTFSEPMDYASVFEGVFIRKAGTGEGIPGTFLSTKGETSWKFVPDDPWQKGSYEVEFSAEVSDFAHNNLYRPFEITALEELEREKQPILWVFELH